MGFETLIPSTVAFIFCATILWRLLRDVIVKVHSIPSLVLVAEARPTNRNQEKHPLWFWIFITGLLVAAAGASMPTMLKELNRPERIVIIVDVGILSMALSSQGTRLDMAQVVALDYLGSLSAGKPQVSLITAGATSSIVLEWTEDRTQLKRALSSLRSNAAPTDLATALDLAATLEKYSLAQVLVVGSDLQSPVEAWRELHSDFITELVLLPVGKSRNNHGFEGIQARISRDPVTDREVTNLDVVIRSVGPDITITSMLQQSATISLESRGKSIPAHITGPTLTASSEASGGILARYSLKLDGFYEAITISLSGQGDALRIDDRATIHSRTAPKILVVDPRSNLHHAIANRLSSSFRNSGIDILTTYSDQIDLDEYDLLLVNRRSIFEPWPSINTLTYSDERDTKLARIADLLPTRLTRYVNIVSPFRLMAQAIDVKVPLQTFLYHFGMEKTRSGNAFPLAAWGERDGWRQVSIGWDWTNLDARSHEVLSIVWLHSLDWLGPSESIPGAIWAGETFPALPTQDEFKIFGPDGKVRAFYVTGGYIEPEAFLDAGSYRLRDESGQEIQLAVNARSADLRLTPTIDKTIPGEPTRRPPEEKPVPWDLPFWIAAAIIFIGELVVFIWMTMPFRMVGGSR